MMLQSQRQARKVKSAYTGAQSRSRVDDREVHTRPRCQARTVSKDDQLEAGNRDQLAAGKETPSEVRVTGLTTCNQTSEGA